MRARFTLITDKAIKGTYNTVELIAYKSPTKHLGMDEWHLTLTDVTDGRDSHSQTIYCESGKGTEEIRSAATVRAVWFINKKNNEVSRSQRVHELMDKLAKLIEKKQWALATEAAHNLEKYLKYLG